MSTHGAAEEVEVTARDERRVSRRQFLATSAAAGAAIAAGSGSVSAATSSVESGTSRSGLAEGSDFVQDPYFAESALTKAKHRMTWGSDDDALARYENDEGAEDELPADIDREDTENVLSVRADKIEAPDLYAFPRGVTYDDSDTSTDEVPVYALESTHWTTTDAATGTVAVSDPDLDVGRALNVASSSLADGETVKATFSEVDITSDAEKRYIQAVVNVNALSSNAVVELVVRDDDGDEKIVKVDPNGDTSTAGVFAAATGNGFVVQQRMGDLATGGSGDGTFDQVQEVEVRISASGGAGDADVTLTALNAEKMSRWKFGSYLANEDTDSEERTSRYEPGPGTFTTTGLDTFSEAFQDDEAVFYDLEYPVHYRLDLMDTEYEWELQEADQYPSYAYKLVQRAKAYVPTGYDLSHSAISWNDDVAVPANRYTKVRTASGVETTDFEDIADTSWSSHGGSYGSLGDTVELAASVSAGVYKAYEATVLLTESEWSNKVQGSSGGGAAPMESGGGGLLSGFGGLFAAIVTGVLGFFGLKSRYG